MTRFIASLFSISWLTSILFIGMVAAQQTVPIDINQLTEKVATAQDLVAKADLVVYATPCRAPEQKATGRQVSQGDLVIFMQMFQVKEVLAGPALGQVEIVRPGVNPLPPVDDPINLIYPGPLAESTEYVLFLKRYATTRYYYILGVWQGVYPLDSSGKTIALLDEGFTSFHGLTVTQLKEKLNRMKPSSTAEPASFATSAR